MEFVVTVPSTSGTAADYDEMFSNFDITTIIRYCIGICAKLGDKFTEWIR